MVDHLEHTDLIRRSKTVFHGAQNAERQATLAFEIDHRIDEVFDDAGAGDLSVLGNVPDQDHNRAGFLGEAHQFVCARAHLRDRAGRSFDTISPQRLDRIHYDNLGFQRFQAFEDFAEIGFSGEADICIARLEAARAVLHLRFRFLAGHVRHRCAMARKRRRYLQQQGGFADAGIAAD